MAEAHKRTKAFIAKGSCLMTYAAVLRVTLRHCHSENKAMQLTKDQEKALAIKHFEDAIAGTLEHFEKLGVNDYYIAVENNAQLNDYTILAHKVVGDTSSALGWSNYTGALITNGKQADEYVKSYPGVIKLHAQTYLSKVLDSFRDNLEKIQK
jgi:hypothetical protein